MKQKIITVESNGLGGSLQQKVQETLTTMNSNGFKLISSRYIQKEKSVYDIDGTPYGKNEQMEMIFEGEGEIYEKPKVLARNNPNFPFAPSRPCNPPRPGGR